MIAVPLGVRVQERVLRMVPQEAGCSGSFNREACFDVTRRRVNPRVSFVVDDEKEQANVTNLYWIDGTISCLVITSARRWGRRESICD